MDVLPSEHLRLFVSLGTAAFRRCPPAARLQVQGGIGCYGSERDCYQIDQETFQARPNNTVCQPQNSCRSQPDGEYSQLDGSSHTDKVTATRVIRIREARRNADHAGDGEARQRTLESCELDRSSLDRSNHGARRKRERRADHNRPYPAQDQAPVAAPKPEADGENLRKKRQKQSRHDDRDGIIVEDARRQKHRACRRPCEITHREMAQLPKVLDNVRKGLAHGPGDVQDTLAAYDGPQFPRGQRIIDAPETGGAQKSVDKSARFWSRGLDADDLAPFFGAVEIDVRDRYAGDAGLMRQPRRRTHMFRGKGCPDFMHNDRLPNQEWRT